MRQFLIATVLTASLATPVIAEIRPDQVTFRELYKELVETNTTLSAGSCTLAAERMAARLKAAGYKEGDIRLFGVSDHPKEGGLVATLNGTDSRAKAILLLAHIDVVEAKREDCAIDHHPALIARYLDSDDVARPGDCELLMSCLSPVLLAKKPICKAIPH